MSQLVIAYPLSTSTGTRRQRALAIEQAGVKEDWPPDADAIIARWLTQGVVADPPQCEVWEQEAGWFYSWVRDGLSGERTTSSELVEHLALTSER